MIKYKASRWGWNPCIEMVEVTRETKKFVLTLQKGWKGEMHEFKEAKSAEGHAYFDNWVEAKAFMQMKIQEQVEQCRAALQRAHDRLGNVKGMKPPAQEDAA